MLHKKSQKQRSKGPAPQAHLKSRLIQISRIIADSSLPEIVFVTTLILARWWQNSDFSYLSEVTIPILLMAVVVSVIYYLYRYILGKGFATHLAALVLAYFAYGYSFVQSSYYAKTVLKFWPDKWKSDLNTNLYLFITSLILAGLVAWLIAKLIGRQKTLQSLQLKKVLLFAVAFMFIVQIVKTGDRMWEIYRQLDYNYPKLSLAKPANQPATKPDIYYLLFDRYGNQDALKNNFDFDNSNLYNYLSSQGFTNRPNAYANYPFTMSSVSSTLAMNYFPEFQQMFGNDGNWQSAAPYRSVLDNPPIAQILKQNGYQYNQLSSWWDFTRVSIQADSNPTESFRLNVLGYHNYLTDLQRDIVNKSVLSAWLKKGVTVANKKVIKYDLNRNPQQNFEAQVAAVKSLAARADKSTPQFSFAHVLIPHDPYIYDDSGNTPTYDSARNDNGVDEATKYTNAVTYLNKRIEDTVSYIRSQSPNAVIVIQADEGPYPKDFRYQLTPGHYYDPADLSLDKMKQKFGVLASYYLPGVDPTSQPIEASVDAFRFILNKYLGYNLQMLPDCHFSTGDKYTIYKYEDQTAKVAGTEPAECKQYL